LLRGTEAIPPVAGAWRHTLEEGRTTVYGITDLVRAEPVRLGGSVGQPGRERS